MKGSSPPLKLDSKSIVDAKRNLNTNTTNSKHVPGNENSISTDSSLNLDNNNLKVNTNLSSNSPSNNDSDLDGLPSIDDKSSDSINERQRKTAIVNKVSIIYRIYFIFCTNKLKEILNFRNHLISPMTI